MTREGRTRSEPCGVTSTGVRPRRSHLGRWHLTHGRQAGGLDREHRQSMHAQPVTWWGGGRIQPACSRLFGHNRDCNGPSSHSVVGHFNRIRTAPAPSADVLAALNACEPTAATEGSP